MKINLKCKDCKMKNENNCMILEYLSRFLETESPWSISTDAYDWNDCKILMMEAMAMAATDAIKDNTPLF